MAQGAFEGKAGIVTGAGSGIGKAIAIALAQQGVAICVADVDEGRGKEVAAAIASGGGRALFVRTDVSNSDAVQTMVRQTVKRLGGLDLLVNNAGLQHVAPVMEFPEAQWERLIGIMLTGTFLCTKYALPVMVEQRWGRVVNIASAHGLIASPFKSAYVSAKHGIVGFTKAVAWEVANQGVTVNAVCPGYVRTPLVEGQIADQAKVHGIPASEVVEKIMLQPQALKRLLEPAEVAAMVLYLCSDAAAGVTGTALPIDGGWTAH